MTRERKRKDQKEGERIEGGEQSMSAFQIILERNRARERMEASVREIERNKFKVRESKSQIEREEETAMKRESE